VGKGVREGGREGGKGSVRVPAGWMHASTSCEGGREGGREGRDGYVSPAVVSPCFFLFALCMVGCYEGRRQGGREGGRTLAASVTLSPSLRQSQQRGQEPETRRSSSGSKQERGARMVIDPDGKGTTLSKWLHARRCSVSCVGQWVSACACCGAYVRECPRQRGGRSDD
jgi:hypothetical protein